MADRGSISLLGFASLGVWALGIVIPVLLWVTTSHRSGESGLIELAAWFDLGTIIVAAASLAAIVVGVWTSVYSPPNRQPAVTGIVISAVTLALAIVPAISAARNWGKPLGCKAVGPDIQIGPDTHVQGAEVITTAFREPELRRLYEAVNSPAFRAALSQRICGRSLPRFTVSVRLTQEGECQERLVHSAITPPQDAPCFEEAYRYLFQQQVRKIDPGPQSPDTIRLMTWPEPTCICSGAPAR